jgi:hypothetical protein
MTLSVFLLWAPQILGSDSLQTRNNASVVQSNLAGRLNQILNQTEEIRVVFQRIAVRASNEGAPGWDRIITYANIADQTINLVRNKIDGLANRLNLNEMPFPSGIHITRFPIDVLPQGIWNKKWTLRFPDIDAPIPNFPPTVSGSAQFLESFIDLVEQPLADALQAANDLDNEMATALAAAKANSNYSFSVSNSGSFPNADYFYGENIRNWLGAPGVVLLVNELSALLDGNEKAYDGLAKQTITLVGEGGNLAVILKPIFAIAPTFINMMKELIAHVDSDIEGAENSASYDREAHIHSDIELIDARLEDHRIVFEEWRTLSIRTRIEINLAGHGDHPHPIAIFQLPEQFGGYLELAQEIVQNTIDNMVAAGQNVHKAVMYNSRGNDKFAAGDYKKAYHYYGKSYREATKEDHKD